MFQKISKINLFFFVFFMCRTLELYSVFNSLPLSLRTTKIDGRIFIEQAIPRSYRQYRDLCNDDNILYTKYFKSFCHQRIRSAFIPRNPSSLFQWIVGVQLENNVATCYGLIKITLGQFQCHQGSKIIKKKRSHKCQIVIWSINIYVMTACDTHQTWNTGSHQTHEQCATAWKDLLCFYPWQ